jgi:predicted amidophosphoribosyltransferase
MSKYAFQDSDKTERDLSHLKEVIDFAEGIFRGQTAENMSIIVKSCCNEPAKDSEELTGICEDCNTEYNDEDVACEYCEGEKEVIDRTRITSRSIDVPYCVCPVCNGTGLR